MTTQSEQAQSLMRKLAESEDSACSPWGQHNLSAHPLQNLLRTWADISLEDFFGGLQAGALLSKRKPITPGAPFCAWPNTEVLISHADHCVQELSIRYGFHPTPFGPCLIGVVGESVCWLCFLGLTKQHNLEELKHFWRNASCIEDQKHTMSFAQKIFYPGHTRQKIRLLIKGTPFQMRVWEALLRIPCGAIVTYQDITDHIGNNGLRAVGSAVGNNHIAYVIPCHRIIRKNGSVGQYRWHPECKKLMLVQELFISKVIK